MEGDVDASGRIKFDIFSADGVGHVIAGAVYIDESDLDWFDESPFLVGFPKAS